MIFTFLVDEILDDVQSRFEVIQVGSLVSKRDGWPSMWTYETEDRKEFLRAVNRFSSNYAPNFGRLLTPLVEGIRVAGPFEPEWGSGEIPKLVLLDGQGIGHTADSASSISTGITRRFQSADVIVLVDNAAQPMQAAPVAVLRTLAASGHESKLAICFTHFDEVKGDNLRGNEAKKDHVVSSFYNAVQTIGKSVGREAENSLKRLIPNRIIFSVEHPDPIAREGSFYLGSVLQPDGHLPLVDFAPASDSLSAGLRCGEPCACRAKSHAGVPRPVEWDPWHGYSVAGRAGTLDEGQGPDSAYRSPEAGRV